MNISWKGTEKYIAGKCDISNGHSSRCRGVDRTQLSVVSLKYCIRATRALPTYFALSRCSLTSVRLFIWTVEARKLGFQWLCVSWMNFQVCNETYICSHLKSKEEDSHQTLVWLLSASTKDIPLLCPPVSHGSTTASAKAMAPAYSHTWISSSTNLSSEAAELRDSWSQEQSSCSTKVPLNR